VATQLRLLACALLLLTGCATTGDCDEGIPGPSVVHIVPPAADLAPALAAYSGLWEGTGFLEGRNGGAQPLRLIVERIAADSAQVLYAWGRGGSASPGGWVRKKATVLPDGRLQFGDDKTTFTLELAPDRESLRAKREVGSWVSQFTLTRKAFDQSTGTFNLGPTASTGTIPDLSDVHIVPPPPEMPATLSALSGTWEGAWDGFQGGRLVVERITPDSAVVVYAWAEVPERKWKGGWERHRARILPGGGLAFGSEKVRFRFALSEGRSTLTGEREAEGIIRTITMKKVNIETGGTAPHRTASGSVPPTLLDHPIIPPAADLPSDLGGFLGTWEGIWEGSGVRARLLIWRIDRDFATVAYGWGDAPNGSGKAGRSERVAIVSDTERTITWGAQPKFTFRLAPDGHSLEGERENGGQLDAIVLTKVGPQGVR
jgi:hypothetical protein